MAPGDSRGLGQDGNRYRFPECEPAVRGFVYPLPGGGSTEGTFRKCATTLLGAPQGLGSVLGTDSGLTSPTFVLAELPCVVTL